MKTLSLPADLQQRWNGPHWRWWSLAAGLLLLAGTAIVGGTIALLFGQDTVAFIMLLMILEILAISAVGSGMLDSATQTMNRGGLAREAADLHTSRRGDQEARRADPEDPVGAPRPAGEHGGDGQVRRNAELERLKDRDQQDRDRKTIRAALIVLPVFITFFVLLFQL